MDFGITASPKRNRIAHGCPRALIYYVEIKNEIA
jgi:hypothetical protein